MPRTAAKKVKFYQIKISLLDSPVPIWRRLLVDSEMPLSMVHDVFQIAMGWWDYHLYEFRKGNLRYGELLEIEEDEKLQDAEKQPLLDILKKTGDKCTYVYDFGDDWHHEVTLEEILPLAMTEEKALAVCLYGKRACPPEDCGGTSGFANCLNAIEDPLHPEHQEMLEWTGESYDPNVFDCRAVNLRLILWTNEIHEKVELIEALAVTKSKSSRTRQKPSSFQK